jgi:hypothetical protein
MPHVEPVLAVDPQDHDRLVAATLVVQEPLSGEPGDSWTVHTLASSDGGVSWTRRRLSGLEGIAGDPWLAWADDGTLHLSILTRAPEADGQRFMRTWLYRSTDAGHTWSRPEQAPFAHEGSVDHPVLSEVAGTRYVFATGGVSSIVVSRASDAGFEPFPAFRPDDRNNNLGSGAAFADGSVVFSYFSMSEPQPGPLWAVRSTDGGASYQRAAITQEHIPVGFPMMAVDRSGGSTHERVYAVFTRSFERPHVMLTHSDDKGASWSEPRRVDDGAPRAAQLAPTVAVSDEGAVAVVWIDERHRGDHRAGELRAYLEDENAESCWDAYASVSRDGGSTFAPSLRLTPETTCSNAAGNGEAGRRWRWGGDYIGVAWGADGSMRPTWADSRTGTYQIWTTRVRIE